MAITVIAPGTVDEDDADTAELYALENHFQILSDGDQGTFYYDEGNYVLEEAAEGEVRMPSEFLKLVLAQFMTVITMLPLLPAGFFDVCIDNATASSEKVFVMMKLQKICLIMSGRSQ